MLTTVESLNPRRGVNADSQAPATQGLSPAEKSRRKTPKDVTQNILDLGWQLTLAGQAQRNPDGTFSLFLESPHSLAISPEYMDLPLQLYSLALSAPMHDIPEVKLIHHSPTYGTEIGRDEIRWSPDQLEEFLGRG